MFFFEKLFNSCRNLCTNDVKRVEERLGEFLAPLSNAQLENLNEFFNAISTDKDPLNDKSPQAVNSDMARIFDFLTGENSTPNNRNNLLTKIEEIQPLFLKLLQPGLYETDVKKAEKLKILINALDSQMELQPPSSSVMYRRGHNPLQERDHDSSKSPRGPVEGLHQSFELSKFGLAHLAGKDKQPASREPGLGRHR